MEVKCVCCGRLGGGYSNILAIGRVAAAFSGVWPLPCSDAKLLSDWRPRLLDAWVKKEIELRSFCDAISAITTLPKDTLQSMLATLPSVRDLVAEQGIFSSTREAAAALTTTMHACESDVMVLKATGFT